MARATFAKTMILVLVLGVGSFAYLFFLAPRTDPWRVCYEARRNKLGLIVEWMVDNKDRFKIIMWCAMNGNPHGGWPIDARR